MRIIILHYHLNPGGVTRVIESQIKSLSRLNPSTEILLLTGNDDTESRFAQLPVNLVVNPLFNYLDTSKLSDEEFLQNQFNQIFSILKNTINDYDLLHCHNLNLGKNPLLSLAVFKLAYQNHIRIVNHSHDFAEDRPANLEILKTVIEEVFDLDLNQVLYPNLPNYFYITLNSFDYQRIADAGIPEKNILLLHNPVELQDFSSKEKCRKSIAEKLSFDVEKVFISYPVRVIKRKNIGEFILFAALFPKAIWTITLPPKNPNEITGYNNWKDFCASNFIDVIFESGLKANFQDIICASDFCFSTSIREGFGMVFIEPWFFETPVKGRNIGFITSDLQKNGLQFPLLYDSLWVIEDETKMDFKDLSVEVQQQFIVSLKNDEYRRKQVFELNPFLNNFFNPD
ncbi:MAG: glycosyltransferase family 4 protein [Bacteroidales bacterium]|nr:glycosyltransferase family 4 protein [Bacteroidales bacterium]